MVRKLRLPLEPKTPQERHLVEADRTASWLYDNDGSTLNRKVLFDLIDRMHGTRLFKKERTEPRWKEIDPEYIFPASNMYPLLVRGRTLQFPWMVSIEPVFDHTHKWELFDGLHDLCQTMKIVTLFVSGTGDQFKATHIVPPCETDAIVLDAYILNTAEELKGRR